MQHPQGSSQHSQRSLIGVVTGVVFASAIVLLFLAILYLHENAQLRFHAGAVYVSALAGFVVFSRLDLPAWTDRADIFSSIFGRWVVVYGLVILSGYFSMTVEQLSRKVMLWWFFVSPVVLSLLALGLQWLAIHYYSKGTGRRKAVFLRYHQSAGVLSKRMLYEPLLGVDPVGYFDTEQPEGEDAPPLPWLGTISTAADYIKTHQVDIVFLGLDMAESPAARALMEALQDSTVSIYFIPDSKLFGVPGVQVTEMVGVPLLVVAETPFLGLAQALKRQMDIMISAGLLIVLSPVLLGVALAVKRSSPGPVIFKQKRYGVGGKEIEVYKFRSMRVTPPSDEVKQATQNDDRITRVGRFIRKTSLDELPQFFNVLQGSMSIVGPRPHAVQHNELYRKLIPGYMLRHKVKPGITGWAQVNGLRGETETVDKMRRRIQYDLVYISHWSVSFDLRIILRTALLVFKDQSAY